MDLLKPSYDSGYAKNASQSAHPNLWDGLVGAWMPSLGVTGETLRDVSGNGNHGTLQYDTSWKTNNSETSLYFDGVQDHVSGFGDVSLSSTEPFSIVSKVRLNSFLDPFPNICQIKTNTSYAFVVAATLDSNYKGIFFGSTNSWVRLRTGTNFATNITQSFVILYNGNGAGTASNFSMYLDGKQINLSSAGGFTVLTQNNYLGTANAGSRGIDDWHGNINAFSIYNRALSPSEIKQLYVDSLAPFRTKKRTVVRVPAAIPAATVVGSIKKPKTIIKPSYQAGYARNASESENPKLWDGLVSWVPSLGSSGSTVRCIQDKSRGIKNNGITFSGSSEQSLSNGAFLSFDGSDDYMRIYDSSLKNFGYTNPDECLAIRFRRRSLTGTTALFGYLSAQFLGAYGRGFYFDGTTMHCMSKTNNNNPAITSTVDDNQWHVAIANFGANGSFYLDGKLIGTGSLNSSWSYWLQLASAAAHVTPPANSANAAVDVSVAYQWDRLLTAGEIKKISIDSLAPFRKKQRLSVAVPAAVAPSATYHPLRSLAHPLEQ